MTDLEGNELEIGTIYILPGNTNSLTVGKYSHETESSFIFKGILSHTRNGTLLYSWKRQIGKWMTSNGIPAIKASQEIINRFNLS